MRGRRTVRRGAGDTVGQVGHQCRRGLRRPPIVPLAPRKGGQPPPPTSARPACPPLSPCAACRGGQPEPSSDGASHLSHLVPLLRNKRSARTAATPFPSSPTVSPATEAECRAMDPALRGGRRVDVHAPFAGGVGVRPAATRAVFGSGEQVHASCSRDRDAPRSPRACDGRVGCRKRAVRRNLSGLRASTRCGRVSTGSYGACRVGQWPEHRLVSIR
jgi:hypothetical protein